MFRYQDTLNISLTCSRRVFCCAFNMVSAKRLLSIAARRAFLGDSGTGKIAVLQTKAKKQILAPYQFKYEGSSS